MTRAQKVFGKYRGLVLDNQDPDRRGRVLARVPRLQGENEFWALPCVPYGGVGSGLKMIPDLGAGVWIEFEEGDLSRPIWSGCWWGPDQAPEDETGDAASPEKRFIRSQSGLIVKLDDAEEAIVLTDEAGETQITVEARGGQITLKANRGVVIEAPQVELGEGAYQSLVLGEELLQYLVQVVTLYQTHVHPGQMAGDVPVTPAPPVPPMLTPPMSMLSKKVKTE